MDLRRLLTGVVKNGVLWGAAWFVLAVTAMLVMRTVGVVVPPSIGLLDMVGMGIRIGVVGGLVGAVFAAFISLFYRGRRLSEISAVRFALGGALVAELFILAFFVIGNQGFPPLADVLDDLIFVPVFGGIAAGASMWLAQRGESLPNEEDDVPAALGAGDPLSSPDWVDARRRAPARRRSGADR